MPIPDEYKAIFDGLVRGTADDKLQWVEGPSDSMFLTSLDQFSVQIDREGLGDRYTISIINSMGREIDSFRVERSVMDPKTYDIRPDPSYKAVVALWEAARRQALRVDEAIDQVRRALDSLGDSD